MEKKEPQTCVALSKYKQCWRCSKLCSQIQHVLFAVKFVQSLIWLEFLLVYFIIIIGKWLPSEKVTLANKWLHCLYHEVVAGVRVLLQCLSNCNILAASKDVKKSSDCKLHRKAIVDVWLKSSEISGDTPNYNVINGIKRVRNPHKQQQSSNHTRALTYPCHQSATRYWFSYYSFNSLQCKSDSNISLFSMEFNHLNFLIRNHKNYLVVKLSKEFL